MALTLEDLSFHLVSYLEGLPGFRGLAHEARPGASPAALEQWTSANGRLALPEDLAGFLECSDGLALRWRATSPSSEVVVGSVALSAVAELVRLDGGPSLKAVGACAAARLAEGVAWDEDGAWAGAAKVAAFALERNPKVGDVALAYPLDRTVRSTLHPVFCGNSPGGGMEAYCALSFNIFNLWRCFSCLIFFAPGCGPRARPAAPPRCGSATGTEAGTGWRGRSEPTGA